MPKYHRLSYEKRKLQILPLLFQGLSNKECARSMGLSTNTINTHVSRILKEYGVKSRPKLIAKLQPQAASSVVDLIPIATIDEWLRDFGYRVVKDKPHAR